MATLSSILNNRIADFAPDETNLEDGEIYVFCSGREFGCFTSCLAWTAPAAGTAKIEIWGSGGSVGCQCCCNYSIGGQSGAYSRKDVTMGADGYVCGNTGHPCMPNAGFCYSGCSGATCLTVCTGASGTCICMCAEGGNGGLQACRTSTSHVCCLQSCCFGVVFPSQMSTGCGYVCGCRNTYAVATAYGGDINCPGTYSCVYISTCDISGNRSYETNSNAIPYGQYTTGQSNAMSSGDNGTNIQGQNQSGEGNANSTAAKSAINRNSGFGISQGQQACWASGTHCACYETYACIPWVPPGQGANRMMGCPDVRNVGARGGLGYIRILFKAT